VQCINEQELLEHAKLTVSVGRQETLAKRKIAPLRVNSITDALDIEVGDGNSAIAAVGSE
jgi:hypothetical protein